MNRLRHALGSDERGQILVIVAGGMIALLAIAALALEGGTLVLNRRDAQNGADLASVAGTREVALKYVDTATVRVQSNVFAAVNKSLIANGCARRRRRARGPASSRTAASPSLGAVNNSGAAIPANTVAVHVMVDKQVGAVIGHAIGFNSWTVSTEATSRVRGSTGSFPGGVMLPIAVCGWTNPARQRLRPGVDDAGARQLRRLQARPDLRPDRRQGRPRRLRLAVVDRLELGGCAR